MSKRTRAGSMMQKIKDRQANHAAANRAYHELLGNSPIMPKPPGAPITQELHNPDSTTNQSKHDLVLCPVCGIQVRGDRIETHLRRVHPDHAQNLPPKRLIGNKPPQLNRPHPHTSPDSQSVFIETSYVETDESGQVVSFAIKKKAPAPQPRGTVGPTEYKICEVCGIQYPGKFIADHYHHFHLVKPTRKKGVFACTVCSQQFDASDIAHHRERCHLPKPPSNVYGYLDNTGGWTDPIPHEDRYGSRGSGTSRGEQDGGRGLGHFRRDTDGTFGSLPMYDDYSEEGN